MAADHPLRAKFARLTAAEEAKGLLNEVNRIGTRNQWEQILSPKRPLPSGLLLPLVRRPRSLLAH